MTDEPLVSVLLATYNRADVLPRALDSIRSQTYDNLEIVVVDDASAEDPGHAVSALNADEVTYVRHDENRGWGAAMNTAYQHADGELFAMIGDDDVWRDEEKLDRQIQAYRNADSDRLAVVCTGWRVISEETGAVKGVHVPSKPADLKAHILGENRIIQSNTAVVTRTAWEAVSGCDERIPRGIDSDLFRRMIFNEYEILFLPEVTVDVFVDREDRMTAKRTVETIRPHIESEKIKFEKFYEQFEQYPQSKSRVLEKIGTHYFHIWDVTRDAGDLKTARTYYTESLKRQPSNWKSWLRVGWMGARQAADALNVY